MFLLVCFLGAWKPGNRVHPLKKRSSFTTSGGVSGFNRFEKYESKFNHFFRGGGKNEKYWTPPSREVLKLLRLFGWWGENSFT